MALIQQPCGGIGGNRAAACQRFSETSLFTLFGAVLHVLAELHGHYSSSFTHSHDTL